MTSTAVKLSFLYLLVVAAAGTFLRAMPFLPSTGLDYQHVLHAHSHLAFLGWVYSALFLALLHFFLPSGSFETPRYQKIFWLTQATTVSMFLAFLLDGYGGTSIALLSIHTFLAIVFIRQFLKDAKLTFQSSSTWFVLVAFGSFCLSALGPLAIPFVKIFGENDPELMKMAVHFYLHFHYNGWFVFGLLALLLKIMETENIAPPRYLARWTFGLLAAGLAPAYFLIVPFVKLPWALDWLVKLAVLAQWTGFGMLLLFFIKNSISRHLKKDQAGHWLLQTSFAFLFFKFSLELFSEIPGVSTFVNLENRFLTIGYLHLIFLGAVTPFFWWLFEKAVWSDWRKGVSRWGFSCFFAGFLLHELYLFCTGLGLILPMIAQMLAVCSFIMFFGIALLLPSVFYFEKTMTRKVKSNAEIAPSGKIENERLSETSY